jgi:hypothetical protein
VSAGGSPAELVAGGCGTLPGFRQGSRERRRASPAGARRGGAEPSQGSVRDRVSAGGLRPPELVAGRCGTLPGFRQGSRERRRASPAELVAGGTEPSQGSADNDARPSPPAQGRRSAAEEGAGRQAFRVSARSRYPLTREELRWCDLVPKDDPRCPALRKACVRGRPRSSRAGDGRWRSPCRAAGLRVGAAVVADHRRRGGGHRLAARQALSQRRPDKREPTEKEAPRARSVGRRGGRAPGETDVARLLERARAAAPPATTAPPSTTPTPPCCGGWKGGVHPGGTPPHQRRSPARSGRTGSRRCVPASRAWSRRSSRSSSAAPRPPRSASAGCTDRRAGAGGGAHGRPAAGAGPGSGLHPHGLPHAPPELEDSPLGPRRVVNLLQSYGFDARERLSALAKLDRKVDQLVIAQGAMVGRGGLEGHRGLGERRRQPCWSPAASSRCPPGWASPSEGPGDRPRRPSPCRAPTPSASAA